MNFLYIFSTSSIGPLAAQSRELPLPYSAPAKMTVAHPSVLYLCSALKTINIIEPTLQVQQKISLLGVELSD